MQSLDRSSVDRPIAATNVGFRLLLKMGWAGAGTGLGKTGTGILEPIKVAVNDCTMGLGKQGEYDWRSVEATKERKKLEIEKEETPELAKKREASAAKAETTERVVQTMNRPFFCGICDKQYKNTMEMQVHLSSYDHNHTKRFKELKDAERAATSGHKRRRAEKQQQREMEDMMRRANAATVADRSKREQAVRGKGREAKEEREQRDERREKGERRKEKRMRVEGSDDETKRRRNE